AERASSIESGIVTGSHKREHAHPIAGLRGTNGLAGSRTVFSLPASRTRPPILTEMAFAERLSVLPREGILARGRRLTGLARLINAIASSMKSETGPAV